MHDERNRQMKHWTATRVFQWSLAAAGLASAALIVYVMLSGSGTPRIDVSPVSRDFGEVAAEAVMTAGFQISNTGDAELEIYRISSSCGCTYVDTQTLSLAPGGTTTLKVTVDHELMPTEGEFFHVVFLATNDPEESEITLELVGIGSQAIDGARAPRLERVSAFDGARSNVEIYFNDACADCTIYMRESLLPALGARGYQQVQQNDYLRDREQRRRLNERSRAADIPYELQSHLMTFVGERLVLAGHIPEEMIRQALDLLPSGQRVLIYQDRMPEMGQRVTDYTVWDFRYPARRFDIEIPFPEALEELRADVGSRRSATFDAWTTGHLLPLVLVGGLLDGINPCAIAVLLFSLALLFTLQRSRARVLLTGGVYIGAIFVAYLGIGLGLFGAITLTGEQHLVARVGSWLLIGLGIVNVKDFFFYGRGPTLSISKIGHDAIMSRLRRTTLPAAALAGFLVGLCTFPCTGGIYVAVLGLLSTRTTFLEGLSYLLVYNVMFVLPLVALLAGLGNARTVGALSRWQARNKRVVKLSTGAVMIVLGASILVWFA